MGIIMSGISIPFEAEDSAAIAACLNKIGSVNAKVSVYKKSFDFRHGKLKKTFSLLIECENEKRVLKSLDKKADVRALSVAEMPRPCGGATLEKPPVIIGFGPAGIFAALTLAEAGYRPVVLERGGAMEERDRSVHDFFNGGALLPDTNIQFGEGGAGAYSDGKLTTRINDPDCRLVTQLLKRHGAPEEAFIKQKPHLGTDVLKPIVVSMRDRIRALGGTVHFNTHVMDFNIKNGRIRAVATSEGEIPCSIAVLATGHSARDVYERLYTGGVEMRPKAFSAGLRIEHLQSEIDAGLYGKHAGDPQLPPGEYALSAHIGGRGCYTFCMCPGGTVVAASSEEGRLTVNGMSNSARNEINANAAICVSVNVNDLPGSELMSGLQFQRMLEETAFKVAGGEHTAPVQRLHSFFANEIGSTPIRIKPTYPRETKVTNLYSMLPGFIAETIAGGLKTFGAKLPGFDNDDAVLTGIETRTSSPLRIVRGDDMHSSVHGLIPCGEGAGYAGGIMSAAVDGIKAARQIMSEYRPV